MPETRRIMSKILTSGSDAAAQSISIPLVSCMQEKQNPGFERLFLCSTSLSSKVMLFWRQSKTKRFRDHRQERSDTESQEDDWNILQTSEI